MKQLLKPAIPSRTTLQILTKAYKVSPDTLQITDLDNFLFVKGAEIKNHPGKYYEAAILNKTGSLDASKLLDSTYKGDEFPKFKELEEKKELPHNIPALLPTFKPFASKDFSSRLSLTGVLLSGEYNAICATDGHKMKEQILTENFNCPELIIPISMIDFIAKMRTKKAILKSFSCAIESNNNWVSIEYDFNGLNYTLHSKCVEGPYPNYKQVIPTDMKTENTVTHPQIKEILATIKKSDEFEHFHRKLNTVNFYNCEFTKRTIGGYYRFKIPSMILPNCQMDITFLKLVLNDVIKNQSKDLEVNFSPQLTTAKTYICNNCKYVIMPSYVIHNDERIKDHEQFTEYYKSLDANTI